MNIEKEAAQYIQSNPHIMHCLTQDVISLQHLAKKISEDIGIEPETSRESIIRFIREYAETLRTEDRRQMQICEILMTHDTLIKNKICELLIDKSASLEYINTVRNNETDDSSIFYIAEYLDYYKIITNQRHMDNLSEKLGEKVIKTITGCIIISFKTPYDNEMIPGILSHISSLFLENEIDIIDFIGSWKDTILVIEEKDIKKAINILNF